MTLDALLDRDCTVEAPAVPVTDGQGGFTTSYGPPVTVRCRRRPAVADGSMDKVVALQHDAEVAHVVYVPTGTAVVRHARVTVDGLTLRVESMQTPSVPIYLALNCSELQKTGD